ncbi:glycine receptor subunit alpha-2-like isoform X2 [Amphiura filiformis]|uniref:glycine receptor subunit alpha-2-like isoform X2 n=1 Tax=Amphiura filiformis TaxID=82378 RepID=UPI003B223887
MRTKVRVYKVEYCDYNKMLWLMILALIAQRSIVASNITATIQELLTGYDHRIRPDHEGPPTTVSLIVFMESIGPLEERTMDFSSSFYTAMDWVDTRLTYTGEKYIILKGDDIQKFWIPDVFFMYEKEGQHHDIIQANQMLKILPDGKCRYVVRVSLTTVCRMLLQRFPFDTQTCSIHMFSFAYSSLDILLDITDNSVAVHPDIIVARYDLTNVSTKTYYLQFEIMTNNTWSGAAITFTFKRHLQAYILTVYIPSILLVTISWMSFWIDAHAAPARITLGITTVLTATTMTASMQDSFPDATGAKAVDIWMAACLIFVFLSLIEYAMTNYLIVLQDRKMKSNDASELKPDDSICTNDSTSPSANEKSGAHAKELTNGPSKPEYTGFSAEHMDKLARVLFALTFLAFNAYYWTFYVIFES